MNVKFYLVKHPCIACNTSQFLQFYQSTKSIPVSQNEVMVFRQNLECCNNCGLVRQENNESYSNINLNKYYSQTFRTPIHPAILNKGDIRVRNAKKRLRFINKLRSTGTLMEVGFGDGIFLRIAAKMFLCTGLDPSVGYRYLHDRLNKEGIEISDKPLEEYSTNKKFNIVCSFLVLEHIKDPIAFIRLQIKHLARNGILVIEVPDIRKYSSFNSESVITYEHVYHYCIESLSFMLLQLNLKLICTSSNDISYGFSLIAAFKLGKNDKAKRLTNGFDIMQNFQEFFEMRNQYQQHMMTAINDIFKESDQKIKNVAVYGTGFLFNYAVDCCGLDISKVDLLLDDTKEKLGKVIYGKEIKSLAELNKYKTDVVIIFSEMFFEPMKQKILNNAINENITIINIHQLSIA